MSEKPLVRDALRTHYRRLIEAVYEERVHPRNRVGKWRDKLGIKKPQAQGSERSFGFDPGGHGMIHDTNASFHNPGNGRQVNPKPGQHYWMHDHRTKESHFVKHHGTGPQDFHRVEKRPAPGTPPVNFHAYQPGQRVKPITPGVYHVSGKK